MLALVQEPGRGKDRRKIEAELGVFDDAADAGDENVAQQNVDGDGASITAIRPAARNAKTCSSPP